MKLYYAPGACSLAGHIALREARLPFEAERVDLKTRTTASGADFNGINPKGYVPALQLGSGEVITENVAVLDYIATLDPALGLPGPLGRTRLLEGLVFISTELHKGFKPFFIGAGEADQAKAGADIARRLQYLSATLRGDCLFGDRPSVADCYLFVILRWAIRFAVPAPAPLAALYDRLHARPAAQAALRAEGLE